MDNSQYQIHAENLERARREEQQEISPIGEAVDELKNKAKKEIKRQIYLWLASIAAAVLPYMLLVFAALIVWYCACANVTGGFKGWALAQTMKFSGLCPSGLQAGYPQNSASLTSLGCSKEVLNGGDSCMIEVSGYSSTESQTDSTPFITANGDRVHVGTLAANFLSFGTRVMFPYNFPNQTFVVDDRMNQRYGDISSGTRMDIWFSSTSEALQWGVKTFTCSKTGEVIMCL